MTLPCSDDALGRYRPWFYAAALYNLVWGSVNILYPSLLFDLLDMEEPNYKPLWQVVGMFVLVYAPAYWWVARYPARHRHLAVIGLLGKLLGPLGFVWAVANDEIPQAFGWTILTNDLVWWPAFGLYLRDIVRRCGGWRALLGATSQLWSTIQGQHSNCSTDVDSTVSGGSEGIDAWEASSLGTNCV